MTMPENPYETLTDREAWVDGFNTAERGLPRDTKSGTSMDFKEWRAGFDAYTEYAYKPAPFNPADIDPTALGVVVRPITRRAKNENGERTFETPIETIIVYEWSQWQAGDAEKPAWADNKEEDRSIILNNLRMGVYVKEQAQNSVLIGEKSIELPCPTYNFTYEEGGITIHKGPFWKWGTRQDFEAVITDLQKAVDDMPPQLSVMDVNVDIDVSATATWTASMSADTLLFGHECYADDVWNGTKGALEDALEDAISNLDASDLDPDLGENFEIDQYGNMSATASDIAYDVGEAEEV